MKGRMVFKNWELVVFSLGVDNPLLRLRRDVYSVLVSILRSARIGCLLAELLVETDLEKI